LDRQTYKSKEIAGDKSAGPGKKGVELTYTELLELIRKGESEALEFKENFDREAVETAGAFANTKGGLILIGVSDKGSPKGIQASAKAQRDWVNQIAQSLALSLI
jgi:ATP-dependent DNA helicase RecG